MRVCAMAQMEGYHYEADINAVDSSGFYNIVLTPEINKHVKTDYSDLRIINDSGKWMPNVIWTPNSQFCVIAMTWDLKIIKKEKKNSISSLIIESVGSATSKLILEIKSTLAERFCTLSGSDDMNSWFTINDSIAIKPQEDELKKNSIFNIEFPAVSYKYLKIRINNNGKDPFNIIKVSSPSRTEDVIQDKGKYFSPVENPVCKIEQRDSGSSSYIRITQSSAYHFYKLSLRLSGAKYYYRNAELYFPTSSTHSFSNPGVLKNSLVLSNNSTLEFPISQSNPTVFYIIIQNEDNPPLKVEEAKTYSYYFVASAWFEKTKHYKVIMDNATASKPNYDLKLNDILQTRPTRNVAMGNIEPLRQQTTNVIIVNKNKWLIWLLIIIAILVLGFFTYKLIIEMNKSKS